ncbi:hypothetical protein F2Q69_00026322 [Brassica cretica]|uniref:RING-CH-type domain-containing protein n=1 Tax=Brassica cretica TaxID=69181 RepID=A0A8S9S4U5_BRACR|nr:hypothetical protein F2Q69_00026322 [Brassica cretica]
MMQGAVQLQPTDSQKLSGSDEIIIKAEDLESVSASSSCCRICLENDRGDELISPCMCKGTQKFVHLSCLDHWRSLNDGSFAFSNCTTCNAQFHLPEVEQPVGDYFTVWHAFLMLQFAAALTAVMTYVIDIHGNFRNSLKNEQVIGILAKHPILFYYSIGES